MKKIIVIGGGAAGAKAASKAKRLNPNNQVDLYTQYDKIAFSLCGLPYFIEGSVSDINKLIIKTPSDFEKMGINVYLNHELQKIYPEDKCVLINSNHIFYDELILALGAKVHIPPIENINLKNVFHLRDLEDGLAIKEKMKNSSSVLIIGGGYIAIELVEAFLVNGLKVILVEVNEKLAHDFDSDFSDLIFNTIQNHSKDNLEIHLSCEINHFTYNQEDNSFKSAISSNGKEFFADFCVLATGAIPNVEVAKNSGVHIGITGGIEVDNKMRTNFENIYACGDCVQKTCIITRQPCYVGLGSTANKEGRVAALSADGTNCCEVFDGVLNSVITRFFDFTFSKTGLTIKKAKEYAQFVNLEPIFYTVTKKDKAGYMPDANELTIKVVADKRSGELLGAQAIGYSQNVLPRINTITSLLKSRSTVDDLLHLDLPYSPPYSATIDPILTCAYKLKDMIKK